jgi:hypothetical protein
MVRNCLSKSLPVAPVSFVMSAPDIMPGIAVPPPMFIPWSVLTIGMGLPQAVSHPVMVAISGS